MGVVDLWRVSWVGVYSSVTKVVYLKPLMFVRQVSWFRFGSSQELDSSTWLRPSRPVYLMTSPLSTCLSWDLSKSPGVSSWVTSWVVPDVHSFNEPRSLSGKFFQSPLSRITSVSRLLCEIDKDGLSKLWSTKNSVPHTLILSRTEWSPLLLVSWTDCLKFSFSSFLKFSFSSFLETKVHWIDVMSLYQILIHILMFL